MKNLIYTIYLLLICNSAFANHVVITDVNLVNDSTINFKISWENSWRVKYAPANHDAVWIFIKKRDCASLTWSHVDLSPTSTDHQAGAPLEVYVDGKDESEYAKGVFIRRASFGSGNIDNVSVTLAMRGEVSGEFDFKIHGIEMVYIPKGEFYIGDGTVANNSAWTFYSLRTPEKGPYKITSENTLSFGQANSTNGDVSFYNSGNFSLGPNFPKGYNEIYCMKYEITQGQYIDFLNSLRSDQYGVRYQLLNIEGVNLQGVYPTFTTQFPYRAMGGLLFADLLAYLDWAALRPMTELEYEKICRGPVAPVLNEYAWGNNLAYVFVSDPFVDAGLNSERVDSLVVANNRNGMTNMQLGNAISTLRCVRRVGFAAGPGTNRVTSGATYYGVMDMTGNVNESTVSVLHGAFEGVLGDGELSISPTPGFANVASWPWNYTLHRHLRGGSFHPQTIANGAVSYRNHGVINYDSRATYNGGRGVR